MHKISFELANQHSLDIQNRLGVQVPSAQIKCLWLGSRCMRPEEHKSEILFGLIITDDLIGRFLFAALWFALTVIMNANCKRQPNVYAWICRKALTHQNYNF